MCMGVDQGCSQIVPPVLAYEIRPAFLRPERSGRGGPLGCMGRISRTKIPPFRPQLEGVGQRDDSMPCLSIATSTNGSLLGRVRYSHLELSMRKYGLGNVSGTETACSGQRSRTHRARHPIARAQDGAGPRARAEVQLEWKLEFWGWVLRDLELTGKAAAYLKVAQEVSWF